VPVPNYLRGIAGPGMLSDEFGIKNPIKTSRGASGDALLAFFFCEKELTEPCSFIGKHGKEFCLVERRKLQRRSDPKGTRNALVHSSSFGSRKEEEGWGQVWSVGPRYNAADKQEDTGAFLLPFPHCCWLYRPSVDPCFCLLFVPIKMRVERWLLVPTDR